MEKRIALVISCLASLASIVPLATAAGANDLDDLNYAIETARRFQLLPPRTCVEATHPRTHSRVKGCLQEGTGYVLINTRTTVGGAPCALDIRIRTAAHKADINFCPAARTGLTQTNRDALINDAIKAIAGQLPRN